MHIDIQKMLPFNPKKQDDFLRCISFTAENSEAAKRKAFEAIRESGSFEILKYQNDT